MIEKRPDVNCYTCGNVENGICRGICRTPDGKGIVSGYSIEDTSIMYPNGCAGYELPLLDELKFSILEEEREERKRKLKIVK